MSNSGIERGKIFNRKAAQQLRDFSKLRYGNITPTDYDLVIDFGNHLFVYGEAKLPGIELPYGQRLCLERQVDDMVAPTRYAIGLVCEHWNRQGDIDMADCIVTEYRWKGEWRTPASRINVRQAIDRTLEICHLDYYRNEKQA